MHPADIKAALAKVGLTQTVIASRAARPGREQVHKSAVSRVISGSLKSAALARSIAEAINQPVSQLWPGKYPQLEMLERAGLLHADATQAESELRALSPKATPRRTTKAARQGAAA